MQNYPIRVLCVFSTLNRGGAESMCMNLYRNIDRSVVQFDYVKHTAKKCDFDDEILSLGGKIYSAPRYRITNHIEYVKWWKSFLKKHPEYKIIHGHFFTISAVYFRVAKKFGRITVAHAHSSKIIVSSLKSFIKSRIIKKTEKYADYRFACSKEAGNWLYPHKDFTVFNNAVDTDAFRLHKVSAEELGVAVPKNALVLGVVGNMTDVKNPLGALEIFHEVKKINDNAFLIWLGEGPMLNEVKEKIKDLRIEDSVSLLGIKSNVSDYLEIMDAFIMPSIYEGLSVALVEAQAAGLQCFASDTVSRETDLTGRMHFLPLGDYKKWATEITSTDLTKFDTTNAIRLAGYDIKDTSKFLQKFYCEITGMEDK